MNQKLKVVRWMTWKEAENIENDCSFDAIVAIVDALRENEMKFGGYAHQSETFKGVPQFDNGKVYKASMRSWGEVMADAWGGTYTDYAWDGETIRSGLDTDCSDVESALRKIDDEKEKNR